jgi:hydrogenase expression/formation protein HypC
MCLAIPAEIVEIQEEMATVRVGDAVRRASLTLLPEPARVGDYVIVHAGFALHKVDPQEAQESLRLLRELAAHADPLPPEGDGD